MQLGLIGLGKMGYPLALNAKDSGVDVLVHSENQEKLSRAKADGMKGFENLEEFIKELLPPRVIWLMIPSGNPVETMIHRIKPLLEPNDIIIDGGNSRYHDSIRRHKELREDKIRFVDVGTSGGTEGARYGACLMVGCDQKTYDELEDLFRALSGGNGYDRMGPAGSGHYVKMIHNGIEYGMMQALGEGLQILRESDYEIELDKVAKVWQKGSIISGLLMDVTSDALEKDPQLSSIEGVVNASGEADWTVEEAVRLRVSVPVIAASLFARYKSMDNEKFSEKSLAAMRNEFGGHALIKSGDQ